jgi:hypothetical protein
MTHKCNRPEERMRKLVRRISLVTGVVLVAVLLTGGGAYWASRQVPNFYQQKLVATPSETEAAGFEEQALALHNQLHHAGRWEARFTEQQINAWLANELPAKFPTLLPPAISDPRVAIENNAVRLAARYRHGNVDTVISLAGDAYLTDQPNELAIRISHARAGYLPLPLGQFLDDIRQRAERTEISLRWTEVEGAPVALVRIPGERRTAKCDDAEFERLVLEEVSLKTGEFLVAGRVASGNSACEAAATPAAAIQSAASELHQR